jgi:hypothetical protein
MLAEPEHYKGLVYVRISTLPDDQRNDIRDGYGREKIIKIIRGNSLLNDCILYEDYVNWFKNGQQRQERY